MVSSLKRQRDGKFRDEDLARVMKEATTNVAGAFGAQGVPPVLRVVEIMAIEEARSWGVCSLNEFRKFMGLKRTHAAPSDRLRSHPRCDSLRELRGMEPRSQYPRASCQQQCHRDSLTFISYRQCACMAISSTSSSMLASRQKRRSHLGLAPVSALASRYRAQSSLTRSASSAGTASSRQTSHVSTCSGISGWYLTSLAAFNLTSWGYQDCARDLNNGSMGGQLSKLLMRTLPDHFDDQSIYAHFPMLTPPAMQQILTKLGTKDKYNWEMNPNPTAIKVVESAVATKKVLETWRDFPTAYGPFMKDITKGYGMYLAWNDTLKHRRDRLLVCTALRCTTLRLTQRLDPRLFVLSRATGQIREVLLRQNPRAHHGEELRLRSG